MSYSRKLRSKAVLLRQRGKTHREIAKTMKVSPSTVHSWTSSVRLNDQQRKEIALRRNYRKFTDPQREEVKRRLKRHQFKPRYTREELLKRIAVFYLKHGRIPLKREFNAWDVYKSRFGSWNQAISEAGFRPNAKLFAERIVAKDGHHCDSLSEKIIDDYLSSHSVFHERHVRYPGQKLTVDFVVNGSYFVEFFGLLGQSSSYDANVERKREIAHKKGLRFIELYPEHLYPKPKLEFLLWAVQDSNL